MNELVWEGLLEILREGQPSLKASARLWRRDDLTGSDWGGQLELPVVFRRLLPADEYHVRLPSGAEARVRVAAGPSTTTMTFPTLTGIGAPPFGTQAPVAAPAIEQDDDIETAAPAPTPAPRARERSSREPVRAHRAPAPAAEPAIDELSAETDDRPEAAAEAVPEPTPVPAKAAAPRAAEPKAPTRSARAASRVRSERPVHIEVRRGAGTGREAEVSVEQTEALARAFLAAIEARQAIRPLEHEGFAGRAIAAARQDIEAIATAIEVALRSRDEAGDWTDDVRSRLTSIAWFGSLALPDEDAAVATAGATVTALLATLEGYLALTPASFTELRAA